MKSEGEYREASQSKNHQRQASQSGQGSSSRGGRDGSSSRGGRDGNSSRGGRDGNSSRGGRDGNSSRGGRDGNSSRGGRDGNSSRREGYGDRSRGGRDGNSSRGGRDGDSSRREGYGDRSRGGRDGDSSRREGYGDSSRREGYGDRSRSGRDGDSSRREGYGDRSRGSRDGDSRTSNEPQEKRREFKVSPARRVAFQALRSLFEEEAFLQPVLSSLASEAQLTSTDRRLTWELVLGVSRRWGTLVAHLDELLSQGIDSVPADVLRALALGAYQLVYLDRIPAYAAVNESVTLAKESNPKFTGVVNKVLKVIQENGLPELKRLSGHSKLAAELSHPEWWVKAQIKQNGLDLTKRIATANNQPAPLSIRISPRGNEDEITARMREEGAILTPLKWAKGGYTLQAASPFSLASHKEELWYVQDEASQLVTQLLAPRHGESVWDVCAAPGGKSLTILTMIGDDGTLLSTDLHGRKAKELGGRLRSYMNAIVCQHDAGNGAPKAHLQTFDKILLDAPCSALGVIRRHPEIRWRRSIRDVKRASKKQRNLLEAVALHLKVGGILVYSVCTDMQGETSEVINDFLQAFPDFSFCAPPPTDIWNELYDESLSLNPADHGTDGFYAVRLTRTR
jgi:16S rRNA (cytosine967-C5)-methyltransferase